MQAPVLLSQRHVHARIAIPTQAKVILVSRARLGCLSSTVAGWQILVPVLLSCPSAGTA